MGAALSSRDPAPDGLAHKLLRLKDLWRHVFLTADEADWAVKHLLLEFSTPFVPPPSTAANGAIDATASTAGLLMIKMSTMSSSLTLVLMR